MKNWLGDAEEQLALAELLAESSLGAGSRLGLIVVDNAIEFMLIAYVEVSRRLNAQNKPGGIPKEQWENTKRVFPKLLRKVCEIVPSLGDHEDEINRNHDLRSDLYHTGLPLTVRPKSVLAYAEIGRKVLNILFKIDLSEVEFEDLKAGIRKDLSNHGSEEPRSEIVFEDAEQSVRFQSSAQRTIEDAISLVIHAWTLLRGREPNRDELSASLAKSGHPVDRDTLRAMLSSMRKKKLFRGMTLGLNTKATKALSSKYLFTY